MQLIEHRPGNHHTIRRVTADFIWVDDQPFAASFILGARVLQTDWPVKQLDDLRSDRLSPLLELTPEIVIIGIGERQQVLPATVQADFHRQGIGVECMTLAAAARTFNILMSENRRALVGMILPDHPHNSET